METGDILKNHEKYMLSFNLLKYYVVLMKNLTKELNAESLEKRYPQKYKWAQFIKTK
jgi:hypothetical protein